MNIGSNVLLLFGLAFLLSASASADNGWYVGGGLGSANVDENFDGVLFDDSTSAYQLYGGWRFNKYIGVRAGYLNLGEFEQSLNIGGIPVVGSLSADGFVFSAQGSLPLGEIFSLNGHLGAFFWDGNAEINAVTVADPGDVNPLVGLGFGARLSSNFSITADFIHYDLEDASSNVFYAGFQIHLGRR